MDTHLPDNGHEVRIPDPARDNMGMQMFRNPRSRRLTSAQERLGAALSRGGGILVVIARFAPAGRSVVSLGAGASHREVKEFLPWSAVAGVAWAGYSVGLGYFGAQWLGPSWLGTAMSVLALFLAGSFAALLVRRPAAAAAAPPMAS